MSSVATPANQQIQQTQQNPPVDETQVTATADTACEDELSRTQKRKRSVSDDPERVKPEPSQTSETKNAAASACDQAPKPDTVEKATAAKTVKFNVGSASKDDRSSSEPDTDIDSEPVEPVTQIACKHYLHRFLLYDQDKCVYVPWDPTSYVRPRATLEFEDPDNFFSVSHIYKEKSEEPKIYLTHWSKTLKQFFQSFIGSPFFNASPQHKLTSFFPILKPLREKFQAAQSALLPDSKLTFAEKLDFVKSLGHPHIDDDIPEEELTRLISQLVEHLGVLMEYLEEQFKPIADRLALTTSHGRIEFDLLIYFFEPEEVLWTRDEYGLPIAFKLTSRSYSGSSSNYFEVKGNGRFWDGSKYAIYRVTETIGMFEGSILLSDLPFNHMTDELRETLQARGRRYIALSGVHHKIYEGNRVMIDRVAYEKNGGYIRKPDQKIPGIEPRHLERLPSTVFGFNLATKKWTEFLVDKIKPIVFDEGAWDHLVLDQDIKTLIKGLVEATKNENTKSTIIGDVISGKGGGLIAVLHGPPGTGKTLTAEAVAETLQRPLYMVGASELSTLPSALERNLKDVLQLATSWDAVLLIDEADVFLEQRSLHEIERNSLVSVALRVLEYHRGVLFLTTNRIKTFDEAFLSRFSVAIRYPDLDNAGRFAVWVKFFKLAGYEIESEDSMDCNDNEKVGNVLPRKEIEDLAHKPFNGRTIKNLVRTAQALALSMKVPLGLEHVRIVVRAQEKFLREFASIKEPRRVKKAGSASKDGDELDYSDDFDAIELNE